MPRGNQHGGREYDDLQNWLDTVWRHMKPSIEGLHDAVRTYTHLLFFNSFMTEIKISTECVYYYSCHSM